MQSAQSREDSSFTEPQCKNFIDLFKLKLALNIIHKILTVYFDNFILVILLVEAAVCGVGRDIHIECSK